MEKYLTTTFLVKFLKFGLVGFSGVIVDFGITYLIKDILKQNKYLANTCGFILAFSSNFFINKYWVFQDANPDLGGQYLRFALISLVGMGLNNTIIYVLNERYKMNFYVSKLVATGVVTFWNFFANVAFTFVQNN